MGAQLTQGLSGNQVQGRFSWRVPRPTTTQRLFEFELVATGAACAERQATTVVIPVQVEYNNQPPTLTSNLPATLNAEPIVIRRVLGGFFEATLEGLDADPDQLTLTAAGNSFDLAAAGLSFVPTNGPGRATGVFHWEPNCDLANQATPSEVTFQLREATCAPVGQQRTVRFEVVSADTLTFLPPNIFTPNTDGTNDYFGLRDLPPTSARPNSPTPEFTTAGASRCTPPPAAPSAETAAICRRVLTIILPDRIHQQAALQRQRHGCSLALIAVAIEHSSITFARCQSASSSL